MNKKLGKELKYKLLSTYSCQKTVKNVIEIQNTLWRGLRFGPQTKISAYTPRSKRSK